MAQILAAKIRRFFSQPVATVDKFLTIEGQSYFAVLGFNSNAQLRLRGCTLMDRRKKLEIKKSPPNLLARKRAGFALAPILYLLGLVGVGAGVLFSGYSQILRSNVQVTNDMTTKSDLNAAGTTLSATSVLGTTDNTVLCPPQGGNATANCASAPVKLWSFTAAAASSEASHLPALYASAGTTNPTTGFEAGVFAPGAGVTQLDGYGHFFIYCRWEQHVSDGTDPSIMVISAGPDGKLDTTCADTVAKNDDTISLLPAPVAINRSAVWQTGPGPGGTQAQFGQVGTQLVVDALGDLTVPGTLGVTGNSSFGGTGNFAGIVTAPSFAGSITGTSGQFTNVTASGTLGVTGASTLGTLSATSGGFSGTLGVTGATTLYSTLSAGASTLDSATITNDATIGGGLAVTGGSGLTVLGPAAFSSTLSAGATTLASAAVTGAQSVGGTLGVTGNTTLGGTLSAGATTLASAAISSGATVGGTLGVAGALNGSSAVFTGNVTANTFTGPLTGNVTGTSTNVTGVVAIANGGTGASDAPTALVNLGANNASNLTTGTVNPALLAADSIPAADLINGQVGATQLDTTGVTPGTYNWGTVDSNGRVTFASNVTNNNLSDGSGDSIVASDVSGNGLLTFTTDNVVAAVIDSNGNLGLGTTSPKQRLDLVGNIRIEGPAASNRQIQFTTGATSERWIEGVNATPESGSNAGSDYVIQSYADNGTLLGTPLTITRATGNATFTGTVTASEFYGNGGGLTNIPASSIVGAITASVAIGSSLSGANPAIANDLTSGLYTPGPSTVDVITAGAIVEQWNTLSGAVDYLSITPGNSGTPPTIAVAGTTANQSLNLTPVGTGNVNVTTGSLNINSASSGLLLGGVNGISYPSGDSTANASIAIGYQALSTETAAGSAAYQNTAIGYQAIGGATMTSAAIANTAVGYRALLKTTSGHQNVAVGNIASSAMTTGDENVAVGVQALGGTSVAHNVAIGYSTLAYATSANNNVAVGYAVMKGATGLGLTGANNTGLGYNSLLGLTTTASNNTALGANTGLLLTTGLNNVIIGSSVASTTLTTGSSNILIGTSSATDTPAVGTNNWLNIGNTLYGDLSTNRVGIGSGLTSITAGVALDLGSNTTAANSTLLLPIGSTATRPTTGVNGMIRYNSTSSPVPAIEAYVNNAWTSLVTVASGLGSGVDLGTSTTTANPQITGDPTSGFYTPAPSTVAVTAGGVEVEQWNTLTSGVDYISITPGKVGTAPTISVAGTTTNQNLNLTAVGTGAINITNSTAGLELGGINAINYPSGDTTLGASIAIGSNALAHETAAGAAAYQNIAIGYNSISSGTMTTTATGNTALGVSTMQSLTSGAANTAVGRSALGVLTTGGNNTAVGSKALDNFTTGSSNTAVGNWALGSQTGGNAFTGTQNTAVGAGAGGDNTAGGGLSSSNNTILGYNGGDKLTTGGSNTIIGASVATTTLTTGSSNILIGTSSSTDTPAAGTSNWLSLNSAIFGDMGGLNFKIGGSTTLNTGAVLDLSSQTDSLLLPIGSSTNRPTGSNGMIRYNSSTNAVEGYVNNTWTSFATAASGTALSSLTSATTTNNIDNATYAQTWTWNTLTTQNALTLSSTSATSGVVLNVSNTNASSTGAAVNAVTASTVTGASALLGTASANTANGIEGSAVTGYGVYGLATTGTGVYGAAEGLGVFGSAGSTGPAVTGVKGTANGGYGVYGQNFGGSTASYGVYGTNASTSTGSGLYGIVTGTANTGYGVYGTNASTGAATGVYGSETGASNTGYGVYALNNSSSGWGIYSAGTSPNYFGGAVGIGTASPNAGAALDLGSNTTASNSTLLLPIGSSAARPTGINGMIRYNSSTNAVEGYVNNAWTSFATAAGGTALSSLTSATTTNNIDNATFAQTWTWNTLTTQNALTLSSTSETTGTLLNLSNTNTASSTGAVLYASTATGGAGYAIEGVASGAGGYAGYFSNTSSTGVNYALYATTSSTGASAVIYASALGPNNIGYGLKALNIGTNNANANWGIYGETASIVTGYGIEGVESGGANTGYAIYGKNTGGTGTNFGVYGTTNSTGTGTGVYGSETGASNTGYAIYGLNNSSTGWGEYQAGTSPNYFAAAVGIGTTTPHTGTALDLGSNTTASNSTLLLPIGSSAARPTGINGMIRYNSSTNAVEGYVNNAWTSFATAAGGTALSSLTSATTTNNIDNATFAQTWTWNTLTTQNALTLSSTSETTGTLLNLSNTNTASSTGAVLYASTASTGAAFAIEGVASGTANTGYGVYGTNSSATGYGVYGSNTAGSGNGAHGIYGTTNSTGTASGVYGNNSGTTNTGSGIFGTNLSTGAASGVKGTMTGAANTGYAIYGSNAGGTGTNYGVYGTTNSTGTGTGVYGSETGASNTGYAVYALNNSSSGWGIYSAGTSPNYFAAAVGIGTASPNAGAALDLGSNTNSLLLPKGTTGQEPTSAIAGMIRYNTSTLSFEGYDGTEWDDLGGGLDTFLAGSVIAPGLAVETDTTTGLFQQATGTLSIATEGVEAAEFLQTSGAVDYLTFTGGAAGNPGTVTIANAGTDTNINIALTAKGTGAVNITNASTGLKLNGLNGISYPSADTTSGGSIAIGYQALNTETSSAAYLNTAVGYQAMGVGTMTTGAAGNTVVGYQAGKAITSGASNANFGYLAGGKVTTGGSNVIIGPSVGSTTLTTGSSNILIGTSSSTDTPAAGTSNWLSLNSAIFGDMGGLNFKIGGSTTLNTGAVLDLSSQTDSLLLPIGSSTNRPTGTNGMIRYNSSSNAVEGYVNNAWTSFATAASGTALSSLTSATTTNNIDNATFAQTWTWNTLTTQNALTLSSTSETTGSLLSLTNSNTSGSGNVLNISTASAGAGAALSATNSGSSNTGYAIYGLNNSANGWGEYQAGTSPNYFAGNVGIGSSAPDSLLDVYSTSTSAYDTVQIETPGTGTSQQTGYALVTKADGHLLGATANNKGWQVNARGNAYTGQANLFFMGYYNGAAWIQPFAITSLGTVGIGTTTMSSANKLEVNGAAVIGYYNTAGPSNGLAVNGAVSIGTTVASTGVALDLGSNTTSSNSTLLLPIGSSAARPTGINGMIRYNSSTNAVEGYVNNAWTSFATAASGTALSSLTSATTTNNIDNATFAQTWTWNTLTTQNALTLSSTSETTGSLLNLSNTNTASSTGAVLNATTASTGTASAISATNSGISSTGYAVYGVSTDTNNTGTTAYFTNATTVGNVSGAGAAVVATNTNTNNTAATLYVSNPSTSFSSRGIVVSTVNGNGVTVLGGGTDGVYSSGGSIGVYGYSGGTFAAAGVKGELTGTNNTGYGVYGINDATTNTSINWGGYFKTTSTGAAYGVQAIESGTANTGYALYANNTGGTGTNYGVYGTTNSTGTGTGVYGSETGASNTGYAIYGLNNSSTGWGEYQAGTSPNYFAAAVGIGTAAPHTGTALDLGSNTTASNSTVLLPIGSSAARPTGINGMIRYNSSTSAVEGYINNTWTSFSTAANGPAISALTAAIGTNNIDNATFAQTWTWNTLTTQNALTLSSTSETTGSLLNLSNTNTASSTGAVLNANTASTGTAYAIEGIASGTANTGYGIYAANTGGSGSNYGLYATDNSSGTGTAIYAAETNTSNTGYAIYATNSSTTNGLTLGNYNGNGSAIYATETAANNNTVSIYAANTGATNTGVALWAINSGGGYGIYALTNAGTTSAIRGDNNVVGGNSIRAYQTAATGNGTAIAGTADSTAAATGVYGSEVGSGNTGYGLYGINTGSTGTNFGVYGTTNSTGTGTGVYGSETGASNTGYAIYGLNNSSSGWGIYSAGTSPNYFGGAVGIGTASPNAGVALDLGSNTTASNSTLLLPIGSSSTRPGTGINGMIRYNSSTNAVEGYVNNAWTSFATAAGGTALSSLTSATTTNNIDNATFAQTWTWNTLTTQNALTLSSTSETTGSLLNLSNTNTASSTGAVLYATTASTGTAFAIEGIASGIANTGYGVYGSNSSATGYGVYGSNTAGSGNGAHGIYGTTNSTGTASGVYGNNSGVTNTGSGIFGTNLSTGAAAGVKGTMTGAANTGYAIYGSNAGGTGTNYGVYGTTNSTSIGTGVYGSETGASNTGYAVYGLNNSTTGWGEYQAGTSPNYFAAAVGIGTAAPHAGAALDLGSNTNSLLLPKGTTGQEPTSAIAGMIRYNTSTLSFEGYDGTEWDDLGGGLDTFLAGSVIAPGLAVETDTTTGLFQQATGTLSIATEGVEAAEFLQTSGAVDYLTFAGGAAGNPATVTIANSGTDTNINIALTAKGTGAVNITNASTGLKLNGLNGISYPSADTTSGGSIAIGYQALNGETSSAAYLNTAVGYQVMGTGTMTTGAVDNTVVGYQAGKAITSGAANASFGYLAGSKLTTGGSNVIVGPSVGSATLTTGSSNILIGTSSSTDTPAAGTSNWLSLNGAIFGDMGGLNFKIGGSTTLNTGAVLDLSSQTDSLLLPIGSSTNRPTGTNGMIRYNSSTNAVEGYVNNAWTSFATAAGGAALSSLTSATTTNNIDNATFAQTWTWNTLTTQNALTLSSTGETSGSLLTLSGANTGVTGPVLNVTTTSTAGGYAVKGVASGATGANTGIYGSAASATGYGVYGTNSSTGAGAGLYGAETGAANTGYAVYGSNSSTTGWGEYQAGTAPNYFAGAVGIGTAAPAYFLHVYQNTNADVNMVVQNAYTGTGAYLSASAASNYAAVTLSGTGAAWSAGEIGSTSYVIYDQTNSKRPLTIAQNAPTGSIYVASSGAVGIGTTIPNTGVALDLGSNTTASNSTLLLPIGSSSTRPGTGVNGMIRYNSSTNAVEGYVNNAWTSFATAAGGAALSSLTSATTTNNIDNATFAQTWTWNTLTTQNALTLSSTGETSGSLLTLSGANTGVTGPVLNVTTTSTAGGYAVKGVASGATGANTGIYGSAASATGYGIYGTNSTATGTASSGAGSAVYGSETNGSNTAAAVYSSNSSATGWGIYAAGTSPNYFAAPVAIGVTATPTTGTALDLGSNTTASNSTLLLPIGSSSTRPGTGVNGMIRYNSSTNAVEGYVNNAWTSFATAAGGTALSSLTSATTTNNIDNATFAQTWTWNTLTTQNALTLSSSSETTGSLLYLSNTNASSTGATLSVTTTSTGAGFAIEGLASGTGNTGYGVYGSNNSATGYGVYGINTAGSGNGAHGVYGTTNSTGTASGVYGNNSGSTNTGSGIFGTNSSTATASGVKGTMTGASNTGYGVYGGNTGGAGANFGVYATTNSTGAGTGIYASETGVSNTGYAVYGANTGGGSVANFGVYGTTNATGAGTGIYGSETGASNTGYAIYGLNNSTTGWGEYQAGTSPNYFAGNVGIGTAVPHAGTALDLGSNTTASNSTLLLPIGSSAARPATGVNGMIRYNSSTAALEGYVNNSWASISTGSASLSGLTSATTTNQIDNAAYAQTWTWNTLTTQNALTLSSSSETTGTLLNLSNTNTASSTGAVLYATTASTGTAFAIEGAASGNANTGYGVYGTNSSGTGYGVYGSNTAGLIFGGTINNYGGYFTASSSGTAIPTGVYGAATGSSNSGYGVYGSNTPTTNTAANYGGYFIDNSTGHGTGVYGSETGASNTGYAVYATNSSASGWGIYSAGTSPNYFAAAVGIGTANPNAGAALDLGSNTNSLLLPKGTTGQEPVAAVAGMIRYNTSTLSFEGYDGTEWDDLGGGLDTFLAGSVIAPGLAVETDTTTGLFQQATGTLSIATEGVEAAEFLQTSGAVDYLTFAGGAAGNPATVTIANSGTDTNINIALTAKGTGAVNITNASTGLKLNGLNGISYPSADTTSGGSIAIGYQALNGETSSAAYLNTAVGYQVMGTGTMTTGAVDNTVVGYQAGKAITSGAANASFGYLAGSKLTTGGSNVIVGPSVGSATLTTGSSNILIGTSSSTDTPAAGTSNWLSLNGAIFGDMGGLNFKIGGSTTLNTGAVLDLSSQTDSLLLPIGSSTNRPTGTNGMIRYNSSTNAVEGYVNNAWTSFATAAGGAALSSLTSATTTNNIDNATFAQTWTWNTLTTQNALTLSSTGETSGSLLTLSGANTGVTGPVLNVTTTSTAGGYAVKGVASGATGANTGIYGSAASATGYGIYGTNSTATGTASSGAGSAVYGSETNGSNTAAAVYSSNSSATGWGIYAAGTSPNYFAAPVAIGVTATPTTGTALDLGSNTTASNSTLLLPIGSSSTRPGTGVNGMIRYNSSTNAVEGYVNNAWTSFATAAGGTALSSLTSATTTNNIDNATFAQTWTWNTLTTQNALTLSSSSETTGSLLYLSNTNASSTGATLSVTTTSTGAGFAIEGLASGTGNTGYGVYGSNNSATGYGVYGINTAGSGNGAHGVYGTTNSTGTASGVYGNNSGSTNTGSGIFGTNSSTATASGVKGTMTGASNTGYGVYGGNTGGAGANFGVYATTNSTGAGTGIYASETGVSNTGYAVYGANTGGGSVANFGVYGTTNATGAGTGIYGSETGASNTGYAIYGLNNSTTGWGEYQAGTSPNYFAGNVGIGTAVPHAGTALDLGSNTTASNSTLLLPIGSSAARPATGVNGMIRYNSSTAALEGYVNNSWASISTGSASLSGLTSATTTNQIDNAAYAQTWTWNTLTTQNALTLSSSSETTGTLLNLSNTNTASSTGAVLYANTASTGAAFAIEGVASGSSNSSYGVYGSNTGFTNSGSAVYAFNNSTTGWGIYSAGTSYNYFNGNVGIGTTNPLSQLQVSSGGNTTITMVNNGSANTNGVQIYGSNASVSYSYYGYTSSAGLAANSYTTPASSVALLAEHFGSALYLNTYSAPVILGGVNATDANNVAIGTSSPGSKLQVSGNVAIGYSTSTAAPTNGLAVSGAVGIGTATPTTGTALDLGSNTTASNSSLLLPIGSSSTRPGTGANGMIRYNSSTNAVEGYVNNAWVSFATAGSNGSISGLTAATGTNNIDNATYAQTWTWNTLTTQNALTLSSTSETSGALLNLSNTNTAGAGGVLVSSAAGASAYAIYATNSNTAGYALYANSGLNYFNGDVGINVTPSTTKPIVVGSTSTNGNGAYLDPTGVWVNASDRRIKENIRPIQYGLDTLMKLRPVAYEMKGTHAKQVGFIAQDVLEVVPEVVGVPADPTTEHYGLSYGNMVAVTVKAIQDLKADNDSLHQQLDKVGMSDEGSAHQNTNVSNASYDKLLWIMGGGFTAIILIMGGFVFHMHREIRKLRKRIKKAA